MSSNAEPSTLNTATKKITIKNRKSLLLVLFSFALPIILAKLALEQNWLDFGVTNHGTLLNNELTLEKLGIKNSRFDQQWLILYALPKQCRSSCLRTLETVHNTYVALGKDMPRVTPVALKQQDFSQQQSQQLAKSQWQILPMPEQSKNIIKQAQVFIVDPLGNVILSHQPPVESDSFGNKDKKQLEQTKFSKAILADMKKLLKYSKVG